MTTGTITPCDCAVGETGCEESVLDLKIKSFESDIDVSHRIVHGDENTDVETENGLVPSFAKVLSRTTNYYKQRWDETIHSMQGVVAKSFTFERAIIWHIVHNLNCTDFMESMRNVEGQKLHAHIEILNTNEFIVRFTEPEAGSINVTFFKNIEADLA